MNDYEILNQYHIFHRFPTLILSIESSVNDNNDFEKMVRMFIVSINLQKEVFELLAMLDSRNDR